MTLIPHDLHRVSTHTQSKASNSLSLRLQVGHVTGHDVLRYYTLVQSPSSEKDLMCGPPPTLVKLAPHTTHPPHNTNK